MEEWGDDLYEEADLRYTCPSCKRIFMEPPPDWLCPFCKQTLRVVGALKLRDKRRGVSRKSDLDE